MELADFRQILEAAGYPVAYRSFPEDEAPPLPYVCYYESGSNNFFADGRVYCSISKLNVELYTGHKDTEAEKRMEYALREYAWQKTEQYISTEKCHEVLYELEV